MITGDGLKTIDVVRGSFEVTEIAPSLDAFDAHSRAADGLMAVTVKLPTQLRDAAGGAAVGPGRRRHGRRGARGALRRARRAARADLRRRRRPAPLRQRLPQGRGHPLPRRARHRGRRRRRGDDPAGGRGRLGRAAEPEPVGPLDDRALLVVRERSATASSRAGGARARCAAARVVGDLAQAVVERVEAPDDLRRVARRSGGSPSARARGTSAQGGAGTIARARPVGVDDDRRAGMARASSTSSASIRSSACTAVVGSLTAGDSARIAMSTSMRSANAGSWSIVRWRARTNTRRRARGPGRSRAVADPQHDAARR